MGLNEMEKRLLFQVEGDYQFKVLNELYMTAQYTKNPEQRKAAENLMAKLRGLTDTECMDIVRDIQKNYRLPYPARTIGEKIAEARQKSGAKKLKGHDIMALERFDPEVRHMIVFDVLSYYPSGELYRMAAMTDLDTLRQDIERNTLYPYGVNMEYRDGTKAEAGIEKWEAMELCEKDALKTWRYLYASELVAEWQHHYSNLFSQWKAQAFSYMPQDLEERLNVEYMEEAQNPDTDMYRIPLGTAKQLLLDGASVYRLLPGGSEKVAPIAAVTAGLWYEHYREFAVTPEDLGALDRLVLRETNRLMGIHTQLNKIQERRPSPAR